MKILLINKSVSGHHLKYNNAISLIDGVEFCYILPEPCLGGEKEYILVPPDSRRFCLTEYMKYMNAIYEIACKEEIDVVHFLYGDYFYRFFGIGLQKFRKKFKVLMTLHVVDLKNKLKTFSVKRICRKLDFAAVHTEHICELLRSLGIDNYAHIEYPNLTEASKLTSEEAKKKYRFDVNIPVISALCGTRYSKGLDLLLKALDRVEEPFQLLVAGKELQITREQIEELSAAYRDRVHLKLSFLSGEELSDCIAASDIIALPYRKNFNGASGPLGEGVACGKLIVGTDYGSIGDLVRKHHLGYLCDVDSQDSIVDALNNGLRSVPFEYDEKAKEYQRQLSADGFRRAYSDLYSRCMEEI